MRVLVILFCWKAYYINPDGTTSLASAWDDQMCVEIAKTDPKGGNPSYCWADGKIYSAKERDRCRPK